jgi:hypothetical protein
MTLNGLSKKRDSTSEILGAPTARWARSLGQKKRRINGQQPSQVAPARQRLAHPLRPADPHPRLLAVLLHGAHRSIYAPPRRFVGRIAPSRPFIDAQKRKRIQQ